MMIRHNSYFCCFFLLFCIAFSCGISRKITPVVTEVPEAGDSIYIYYNRLNHEVEGYNDVFMSYKDMIRGKRKKGKVYKCCFSNDSLFREFGRLIDSMALTPASLRYFEDCDYVLILDGKERHDTLQINYNYNVGPVAFRINGSADNPFGIRGWIASHLTGLLREKIAEEDSLWRLLHEDPLYYYSIYGEYRNVR